MSFVIRKVFPSVSTVNSLQRKNKSFKSYSNKQTSLISLIASLGWLWEWEDRSQGKPQRWKKHVAYPLKEICINNTITTLKATIFIITVNFAVVNSLKQSHQGNSQDEAYTPKRKRKAHKARTGLSIKPGKFLVTHLLNHFREILDGLSFFSAIISLPILSVTVFFYTLTFIEMWKKYILAQGKKERCKCYHSVMYAFILHLVSFQAGN